MRELIYLSESKLGQFATAASRGRVKAGSIGAGGVSVGIELGQGSEGEVLASKLEKVIGFLVNRSTRPPLHFTDPEVRRGEWIEFDDFMTLAVVTSSRYDLAICVQQADRFSGDVALLLYGAPRHVLPYRQRAGESIDIRELDSWVGSLGDIMNDLGALEATGQDQGLVSEYGAANLFQRVADKPGLNAEMQGLARVIDVEEEPEAFTYREVEGRPVAHRPSRLVVASPLYIQYQR
jgi:hypothetical protein